MDLSIAGEQTDGSLPAHRTLSGWALWWISALLLAAMIAIVLPIGRIKMLGAKLSGVIGSYDYGSGGHYDVAYSSDGTWATSNSASSYSGSFTNACSPSISGIDASAKCGGTITATFTWSAGPNNEPPPDSVIVEEDSSVQLYKDSNSAGGALIADDGLGDAAIASSSGALSSGARYSVVSSPGVSFAVYATLQAKASVSGATTYEDPPPTTPPAPPSTNTGHVGCLLSYAATPTVPRINLSGTTMINGKQSILIGQQISASVDIGNLSPQWTANEWAWSNGISGHSGDPFVRFAVIDNDQTFTHTGQQILLQDADKAKATFSYCYRSIGDPGDIPPKGSSSKTQTISCVVTLASFPWRFAGIKLHTTVNVYQPDHALIVDLGELQKYTYAGSLNFGTTNRPADPSVPGDRGSSRGCNWKGLVTTPDAFTQAAKGATGNWCYAQCIVGELDTFMETYMNGTRMWTGTSVDPQVAGGTMYDNDPRNYGLDGPFPYGGPYVANGSMGDVDPIRYPNIGDGDDPGFGLSETAISASMDFSADAYMLYMPPGASSTWVPLHEISWEVHGNTSGPGWALSTGNGPHGITEFDATVSHLPTWIWRLDGTGMKPK